MTIIIDIDRSMKKSLTRAALLHFRHRVIRKHGAFTVFVHDEETMRHVFDSFSKEFSRFPNSDERAILSGFDLSGMKFVPNYTVQSV